MASESTATSSGPRATGGRTTPVLVPQGALAGRPDIPLDRAVTTVGSSETSRLHLISRTISKSHALLVNSNGGTYVADLASRTGVVVNGKTVRDGDLKTGDRVQIGKFLFRYRSPTGLAPARRNDPPSAAVIVVGSPAITITGRVTLIGRRETSEVALVNDPAVSAAHAVIFQVDDKWVIRDLGSRTGTTINSKPVHQQVLKFGDRIEIGSSSILFQPAKAPAAELAVDDDDEPGLIPVETESTVPVAEPEPVRVRQTLDDEFQLPLADEVEPTKPSVPAPAVSGDTLIATEHAEVDRPSLLDETLPIDSPAIPLDSAPEPVVADDEPSVEPPSVSEEPGPELPIESVIEPSAIADEQTTTSSPVEAEALALLDETLPQEPVAAAVEPALSVERDSEPLDVLEPVVEVPAPPMVPPPMRVAVARPRSDEPIELEELPAIDFAVGHEPSPRVAMSEPTPDAPSVAETRMADEPVVEEAAPLAAAPIETPPETPATLAEPDPIAVATEPPVAEATETHGNATINTTINVPAAPVESADSVVGELPEVIFWGDPELDAASERVILAATDAPPVTPVSPVAVVENELAASPAVAEESGDAPEPVPQQINAEPAPPALIQAPAQEPVIESLASVHDDQVLVTEPLLSMPADPESLEEISLDDPVDVEMVFGDESAAPVDDFSPEGTVATTTAVADDLHAFVNEHVPGDDQQTIEFADEQATVAESTARELPETDELLTGDEPDAPIEGLEQLSAADPLNTVETDLDDLEWIDDSSPIGSVHGLILGDEGAEPVAEATTPVAEVVPATEGLAAVPDDLDFLDFGEEADQAAEDTATTNAAEPTQATITTTTTAIAVDEPESPGQAHGFIPTDEPKPRSGPSLFGFDFEGGSFLGGMPLKLSTPLPTDPAAPAARVAAGVAATAATPAATAALVGVANTVFDVNAKARTGLGGMLTPPPVRARPSPPAAPPPATSPSVKEPVQSPSRPMTPPRPVMNSTRPDTTRPGAVPLSLTGLGTDSRSSWPGPPEIPPTAKGDARSAKVAETPRSPAGGASTAAGKKRVNLDVFSQGSAPIGVEVFSGRATDPATIHIPDARETRALAAAEVAKYPGENGESAETLSPDASYVAPRRRSKIPLLLLMMFVFPIALFGAIFSFVPSTAKIVGTLKFEGGAGQNSRAFGVTQIKRLRGSSIAATARAMLGVRKIPPGFTEDAVTYNTAMMDNPEAASWDPGSNTLTLEYASVEYPGFDFKSQKAGPAQVNAVLAALQSADQDLIDIQARAKVARDNAADAHAAAQAAVTSIVQQRKVQSQLAQDTPDQITLDQLDHEAARLKQQWSDAKTIHDSSATVLDELRKRDPSKPIDIDHDPQVVDLQHQLDQLNDQITRSRATNGGTNGTNGGASNGAWGASAVAASTTQPADADPLVSVLQDQANRLSLKLEHRKEELSAEAALTPEQRSMNLQSAIENMSVKLTALDRTEADAKDGYDHAAAAATAAHQRADKARAAGAKLDDLTQQQITAEQTLRQAVDNEKDKQAALDGCITVATGSPISVQAIDAFDPQWPLWAVASALVVMTLSTMIYGEATRPVITPGATPAAAPLVNPPLRSIPWPQPHQLEGLQDDQPQNVQPKEPEQFVGI